MHYYWTNVSWLLATLACTTALAASTTPTQAATAKSFTPREDTEQQYIFSLKRGAEKSAAFEQIRPTIRQRLSLNWPDRQVYTGRFRPSQVSQLRNHPSVQYIEVDHRVHVDDRVDQATPNPPRKSWPAPSGLVRRGQAILQDKVLSWGLERIWQRESKIRGRYEYPVSAGSDVHIYIVDSGVNVAHPEFNGRAVNDVNFVADEGPEDLDGHGTHVAGIAASLSYGVAKNARIHSVKVLNAEGVGYVSDVVRGLLYVARNPPQARRSNTANGTDPEGTSMATANGIRVVNLSLHTSRSSFLNDAVTLVHNSGVVVVSAAGNTATDACDTSPASSGKVISVGATDRADRLASFSAYGKCVNILAPGVSILSTWNDGKTQLLSGTSMASPFVAGVVALYLAEKRYTSQQQVIDDIVEHATNLKSGLIRVDTPSRMLNSLPY